MVNDQSEFRDDILLIVRDTLSSKYACKYTQSKRGELTFRIGQSSGDTTIIFIFKTDHLVMVWYRMISYREMIANNEIIYYHDSNFIDTIFNTINKWTKKQNTISSEYLLFAIQSTIIQLPG